MKVSFSTLGCPNWTFSEILSTAKDLGYDGIELRGLGEDLFLPECSHFLPENLHQSKAQLDSMGLAVSCISTDCRLHESDCRDEMQAYMELAAGLGCPCIRVLGDTDPWPGESVEPEVVAKRIRALIPKAESFGVSLLLETNGRFAESAVLRRVIEEVASPALGVLWDIHHPFRYYRETPETTYGNIGKYVRHVHVKDSKSENGKLAYKMLGYGDLPLREAFSLLRAGAYKGYISLEWTKRWNAELEDAGIVFSHYIYAVRRMWGK